MSNCVALNSEGVDRNHLDVHIFLKQNFWWYTQECATGRRKNTLLQPARIEQILILMQLWHSGHANPKLWANAMVCLLSWAEWCPETSKDLGRTFEAVFHHFRENGFLIVCVGVCMFQLLYCNNRKPKEKGLILPNTKFPLKKHW